MLYLCVGVPPRPVVPVPTLAAARRRVGRGECGERGMRRAGDEGRGCCDKGVAGLLMNVVRWLIDGGLLSVVVVARCKKGVKNRGGQIGSFGNRRVGRREIVGKREGFVLRCVADGQGGCG